MKTIQKKCQVILLPTDKNTQIVKHIHADLNTIHYRYSNDLYQHEDYQNQYIYILSDEEIKEGDWVMYVVNVRGKFSIHQYTSQNKGYLQDKKVVKKIIATTNPDLYTKEITSFGRQFHKPTDQFIQQWIAKGCPEFVNVEYDLVTTVADPNHFADRYPITKSILKVSSENTITCSFIEDDWDNFFDILEKQFGLQVKLMIKETVKENYNLPTKK